MLTMLDIYKLENKKRQAKTEVEFDKLIELENEYKKDTNYNYLLKEAKNYRMRKYRLNKYTKKLMEKPCIFLTITLDTLCEEYEFILRIKRYLKSNKLKGFVNLDYGGQNGRLHAHALVQADFIDNSKENPLRWKYGALNIKKCLHSKDYLKLSHYISKLTNHAVKSSTVGRVIYIR